LTTESRASCVCGQRGTVGLWRRRRDILRSALSADVHEPENLFDEIRRRIVPLGGVDLDIPPRSASREPPRFED
jgi:hypothetical protein